MKKLSKTYFLFLTILLFMFLGSINKILTYTTIIANAIIVLIIETRNNEINNKNIPNGILLLLLYQNLSIGIGAHISQNTDESLKYITQIPFMSILIIWLGTVFKRKIKKERNQVFFELLILCIIFSLFIFLDGVSIILIFFILSILNVLSSFSPSTRAIKYNS